MAFIGIIFSVWWIFIKNRRKSNLISLQCSHVLQQYLPVKIQNVKLKRMDFGTIWVCTPLNYAYLLLLCLLIVPLLLFRQQCTNFFFISNVGLLTSLLGFGSALSQGLFHHMTQAQSLYIYLKNEYKKSDTSKQYILSFMLLSGRWYHMIFINAAFHLLHHLIISHSESWMRNGKNINLLREGLTITTARLMIKVGNHPAGTSDVM